MKGIGANGPEYHQDHVPVREAEGVTGHAVRQMYLATAIADLYMESGEQALLNVSRRYWDNMTEGKMYITGGVGSRFDGESFGEPYELPADQCYCETCAAIGNFFWNWRLLLISGESRYADLMERLLYNGILSSPSLEGTSFFYVNPLMIRNGGYVRLSTNPDGEHKASGRPEWHSVSCCPPNVMRLLASLSNYFATRDEAGIQIHQFSNMDISSGQNRLTLETEYPWNGQIKIIVKASGDQPWKLAFRLPGWCERFNTKINGQDVHGDLGRGYITIKRRWTTADVVDVEFAMPPFWVEADPRVDSVRGCVALQRGPVVYCLEGQDQEPGVNLLDMKIDPSQELTSRWRGDLLKGVVTLEGTGYQLDRSRWQENGLYRPLVLGNENRHVGRKVKFTAIPYYAWGNRGLESMRVWIPYIQAV